MTNDTRRAARIAAAATQELIFHGVPINCAYETRGQHHAATLETPEEFPEIDLVAVNFGRGWLSDADTSAWDEQLGIVEQLYEDGLA